MSSSDCEMNPFFRSGKGCPLILIHGIMCDHTYFDPLSSMLSSEYQVITYDRRGYGLGSLQPDSFAVMHQVDDLHNVVSRLQENGVYLLAHSAGCIIAAEFACRYPSIVRGLILVEPAFGLNPEDKCRLDMWNAELNRYLAAGKVNNVLQAMALQLGLSAITGKASNRHELTKEKMIRAKNNLNTFLYGEINEIQRFRPELSAFEKITCPSAIGVSEEGAGLFCGEISIHNAEQLNWPLFFLPGNHNTLVNYPEECGISIMSILKDWRKSNVSS